MEISTQELWDFPTGTYAWRTTSRKIRLTGANSSTVTVQAMANPSSGRDAETITVTRTSPGCAPIEKTVSVTVARVTFSASRNQRYGYDNFDTPGNPRDDHICVKSADHTFVKVDIAGGAIGTDFTFSCENASVEAIGPPASASFDLRLNANVSTFKMDTTLHARCRCPEAHSFASLAVHVYSEKRVQVVVAKIGTNLGYATADYASHQNTENNKLKQAVVRFEISNFNADNSVSRVHYDLDGNGKLTYDIANGGGRELDAIRRAMTGTGTKTRVAIVRDMVSYYYLNADAPRGQRWVTVRGGSTFYTTGDSVTLGSGATQETLTVASKSGNRVNFTSALTHAHRTGETLEFPAAGWSCDPILIIEGNTSLDTIKWTIPHEVGHRNLSLKDVEDRTNVMHSSQGGSDYRLRYCPRRKTYEAGTENQWDTIPR
ncbi:MAG: hypothetical protein MUD15_11200 [Desulfobacterota bacterium]|nr:hypothetical protein [Thermodesulfobacteriota bacterium]